MIEIPLDNLKDLHSGESLLILGTGPSLDTLRDTRDVPMETMSMGRSWRKGYSRYHVVLDAGYWQEVIDGLLKPELTFYVHHDIPTLRNLHKWQASQGKHVSDVCYVQQIEGEDEVSLDLTVGTTTANNQGQLAFEIALHLGYSEINLLGFDLGNEGHFSYDDSNTPYKSEQRSKNPNAHAQIVKLYERCAPAVKARGVKVTNLNADSCLRCFDFSELR